MKKFSFGKPFMALAILLLVLVFGLAFVGCKNEVEDDPLNGTYVTSVNELILNNGTWSLKITGNDYQRGTYEASDGNITLTVTDMNFDSGMASQFNTTVGWKTRSQLIEFLRNAGYSDAEIGAELTPTGTYSGNTITFGNTVFTRN